MISFPGTIGKSQLLQSNHSHPLPVPTLALRSGRDCYKVSNCTSRGRRQLTNQKLPTAHVLHCPAGWFNHVLYIYSRSTPIQSSMFQRPASYTNLDVTQCCMSKKGWKPQGQRKLTRGPPDEPDDSARRAIVARAVDGRLPGLGVYSIRDGATSEESRLLANSKNRTSSNE